MPTANFNRYFPDYEILSELGRANARVLKARHRQTQEIVAIKHYALNADNETLVRFQRESEIMISVKQANVVKITDVQLTAELPYIVMEFVEGGDVRSLLKKQGSLDVSTVIRLGLQMADALDAIHKLNIIHRDIKPDNIMYRVMSSGELHFLLTDFGISKVRGSESVTITGQSPMTLEYASPEQFEDTHHITTATDYYSLGVVLYECLMGTVPFPAGTKGFGSYAKIVETQAPPVINLPKSGFLPEKLRIIVNGLLDKHPKHRLSNLGKLRKLLKEADADNEAYEEPIFSLLPSAKIVKPPVTLPLKENKQVEIDAHSELPKVSSPKESKKVYSPINKQSFLISAIILMGLGGLYYYQKSLYSENVVSPPEYMELHNSFSEGLASVWKDDKWGYIDKSGKVVIAPIYEEANDFSEGLACVNKDGKWGYIDKSGKVVIPPEYEYADSFSEGLARIKKDGKLGYINKSGKVVIPPEYEHEFSFSEGLASVYKEGKWEYIDKTGKVAIPIVYAGFAFSFSGGLARLIKNNKSGYIDKSGKVAIPIVYEITRDFSEGLALVQKDGKCGYINKSGKVIIPPEYELQVTEDSFSEELVSVMKDGKCGYIDKSGKVVVPIVYAQASDFSEGLACVKKDDKWGYIDKSGKVVIPIIYDQADSFSEGLALVKKEDGRVFINKSGDVVIQPY